MKDGTLNPLHQKMLTFEAHQSASTMKPMLLLPVLLFTITATKAQKVYTVDYQSQADVKVFVVQYES